MYSRAAAAFNAKLQAFTERNLALAEEVRTIGHEDAGRPIEDMPFAERHARIVKHRTVYALFAVAHLFVLSVLVVGAIGFGVAVARLVNLAVTP
jgi:nitrate reductase NapE component